MPAETTETRVLVIAPTERDAEVTHRLLAAESLTVEVCKSFGALVTELYAGAGAVVMTDHAGHSAEAVWALEVWLSEQPEWSELPIILLARAERTSERLISLRALPGIVLLERPVYTRTLVSAVRAGLRARKRQYAMRGTLEEVRLANEQLSQSARGKDEFLATLSHELRNPLSAMTGAVRLLDVSREGSEGAVLARQILGRQTQQMTRLLDDLLDVARITRGRLELRRQSSSLSTIVTSAIESAQHSISSRHHRLSVDIPRVDVVLQADPARLSQVIGNLLTNAAKYTESGGHIHLSATVVDDEVVISVRDDGMGIPPEALESVFSMFMQLSPAIARSEGGLGIGLALSKGIVELHGGSIVAKSAGPGQGSEFQVRLPLGASAAASESAAVVPGMTASRHILIADDNNDAAETLAALARLNGHRVTVAHDGIEALERTDTASPDVILLDIGMPRMNGYDVARNLQTHSRRQQMKLIALTGWGQPADRAAAMDAGFDHHLTKPVDVDELLSLL